MLWYNIFASLTSVGIVLHRVELLEGLEAPARLELLLLGVAEELGELLVQRPQGVDLLEPPAHLDHLVGDVGAALPHVRRVVAPEDGGLLLADVHPFLAEVDALETRLDKPIF